METIELKRIEDLIERKIKYSRRRKGLLKKAHELSVLCDVDVAIINFSPTGKLKIFTANDKSVEEIMERYLSILDGKERRMKNQKCPKCLWEALDVKMRAQKLSKFQPSSSLSGTTVRRHAGSDAQIEELQQEIITSNAQLEAMEKRLRIFQGDPYEITTLSVAQHHEHILKKALRRVSMLKVKLENESVHLQAASIINNQVDISPNNALDPGNETNVGTPMDWLSLKLDVDTNGLSNVLDPNIVLPSREKRHRLDNPSPFFYGTTSQQDDGTNSNKPGGKDDERPIIIKPQLRPNMKFNPWPQYCPTGNDVIIKPQLRPNMNFNPWPQYCPTGNDVIIKPHLRSNMKFNPWTQYCPTGNDESAPFPTSMSMELEPEKTTETILFTQLFN